jgi:long-chain acyl-CoA synthetase
LKCENLGSVKNIVSFDAVSEDVAAKYKEKGITLYNYQQLLEKYEKSDVKVEAKISSPTDVVSFCYTSGTTGPPKGAMLSGRNFAAYAGVLKNFPAL